VQVATDDDRARGEAVVKLILGEDLQRGPGLEHQRLPLPAEQVDLPRGRDGRGEDVAEAHPRGEERLARRGVDRGQEALEVLEEVELAAEEERARNVRRVRVPSPCLGSDTPDGSVPGRAPSSASSERAEST
jgi:hypothetical protein